MDPLVLNADRVHAGYHALGNAAYAMAGGTLVANSAHPHVHDANVLVHPVVRSRAEADRLLAELDRVLRPPARCHVHMGVGTAPALEARLAADGWTLVLTLDLLLDGALQGRSPTVDIRLASNDADWSSVDRLFRVDHIEEAVREERLPYPEAVTQAVVDVKRAKAPHVRVWLARDDGVDCGVFTSWDGVDRMGMVEDLFVLPDHRGRGIARALVHHAVADARSRGARTVLIGALVDDTPKDLYRRMGFDPLMVRRCWLSPLQP